MLDEDFHSLETWFKDKSEQIKARLQNSVQDMQKYLELENLGKEKSDVLKRLSHLPIRVRDSISNSILLSEQQFNMLTNYEVTKKVIVANGMVTKLEVGTEQNCLYVGGSGTFISKYSLETKQLLLASDKIYFCNGLQVDNLNQVWVMDGKKASLFVLNHNLQERREFKGFSFDRSLELVQKEGSSLPRLSVSIQEGSTSTGLEEKA